MTYNIEIFKSESYQKISKAVLKFRYPDLSYKEALIEETQNPFCLSLHNVYDNRVILDLHRMLKNIANAKRLAIFGTPITLAEVIRTIILHTKIFAIDGVDFIAYDKGYSVLGFEWILFNYLHEQTQETIDEIAKLLD